MELLTILFTGITAITAIASIIIAVKSLRSFSEISRAQLFLELQNEYIRIQGELNLKYRDDSWVPKFNSNDWKTIERFWYHTFKEWFVTKKINKGKFTDLWDDFFADAIYRGLKHKPLVYVLKYLVEGGSSFSGKADDFKREMERLYLKKENKRLF